MKDVRTVVSILCVGTALWLAGAGMAQDGTRFKARLSIVPVDEATARTTSGSGSVTAVLVGSNLFITGRFDGMSSPATAAHLHRARKRQRGPVAFTLSVANAASGVLGGSVELSGSQVPALKEATTTCRSIRRRIRKERFEAGFSCRSPEHDASGTHVCLWHRRRDVTARSTPRTAWPCHRSRS